MKFFKPLSIIINALWFIVGCSPTLKIYPYDDKNRTGKGQLNDTVFNELRHYLKEHTSSTIKDTIIIKYDYNNETCWNRLDEREDENIMGFVKRKQQAMEQMLTTRKNVSSFNFREPGENLNKLKLWDSTIIIDSSKQLYHLLFMRNYNCGNSILVLPDKRFIYILSDPHSEIFYLTSKQIEFILNDK